MDDQDELCGQSFDHDLRVTDERDGWTSYECRRCGAEIVDEPINGIDN